MATTYHYVVAITVTHPRDGSVTEHVLRVEAYSVCDAMMQASIELDATYAFTAQQYTLKVVSIAPDTETAMLRLLERFKELSLHRMPTLGQGSS